MTDHTPSRACYLRGCRHPECKLVNYRYHKQLATEHQRGQRRLHDATQVRAHIDRLTANNWRQADIARAARIPRSTVSVIARGQRYTNKRNAAAILAIPVVTISRTDRGDRVDAIGSIRRLRALSWLGHPFTDVGTATGMTDDRLSFIACGKTDVVTPAEAGQIASAYRRLSTTRGHMPQVATTARNKGWHGPLAWDDIDDPNCHPEKSDPFQSAPKFERDPDRKAEIAHLSSLGESVAAIAKQLGNSEKYVRDQLTVIRRERAKAAGRAVRSDLRAAA
ncbi:hypothetical protein [Streptomyces werraensis]|uniref:hypothetical protein n=1 Tax=Streptomyces werraensis TaxID=68284 RepID=UPI003437DDC4